jgi:hypothetical protein
VLWGGIVSLLIGNELSGERLGNQSRGAVWVKIRLEGWPAVEEWLVWLAGHEVMLALRPMFYQLGVRPMVVRRLTH